MDPDELVQCPYDRSHRVRVCRLPYHLVKCGRNNPLAAHRLASCPFNARHQVPQAELQSHLSSCPDREQLDLPQDIDLALGHQMKQPEALPGWAWPPRSEDWEAELEELEEPPPFILKCGVRALPPTRDSSAPGQHTAGDRGAAAAGAEQRARRGSWPGAAGAGQCQAVPQQQQSR